MPNFRAQAALATMDHIIGQTSRLDLAVDFQQPASVQANRLQMDSSHEVMPILLPGLLRSRREAIHITIIAGEAPVEAIP